MIKKIVGLLLAVFVVQFSMAYVIENNHKGVQLWAGGPYWAETNIGAQNSSDYGYYFWWGDTVGYKRVNGKWVASNGYSSNFSFDEASVPTYNKSYSTLKSQGWINSSGVLTSSHDAARVYWGSNWRMPTASDLKNLMNKCTWTWTTKNGVYGCVVKGKGDYSGASIFLPAAGYGSGTSLYKSGVDGGLWSSVPNSSNSHVSWCLDFTSSGTEVDDNYWRYCGHPIRPVLDTPSYGTPTGTIVFNANGGYGSMSSQVIAVGATAYIKINRFKRTGYTFQGWARNKNGSVVFENGASIVNNSATGTTTFYAVWKPISYTVYFAPNGGYNGSVFSQTMTYDKATYLKRNTYKRAGYSFAGWAKSPKGVVAYKNGQAVKNLSTTIYGSVFLYAVWAKPKYKVAFYANGGSGSMSSQSMSYNKAYYLKGNTFKRAGYSFAGWAKSKNGAVVYKNGQAVKNLTTTGGTVKLYAKWKRISYKVVFYGYGGKGSMSAQTIPVNKAAYLKKNAFKRTGYAFQGWAKSAALAKKGKVAYKNRQVVKNLLKKSGTVKLIAVWKPITYKVVFYPNGASGKAIAQSMTYNKAANLKKNVFKRSGYIFLGWAKTKNGAVAYKNAQAVKNLRSTTGIIALYAVWAKTTYKVAFYANGGSGSMSAQTMTYNKAANLKKNTFTRTGYTFLGWAKSSTGSVAYADGKLVKNLTRTGGTVKLYAVWKPNTYKVTFYPNGGTGSAVTQTMTYNKAANLRSNTFKRTGYAFAGWAKSTTGSVAYTNGQSVKNLSSTNGATVKLYAVWKPNTYKVTFYPNGGTGSAVTQTMTHNKAANLRSNTFTRTGYTFVGWAKSTTGSVVYTNGQSVKNLSSTNGATVKLYAVWKKSSTMDFTTSGDSNWFYDDDGTLTSGTISHSQRTILETTVFGAGTISFNWAVSSEANYDWLSFYVDDELVTRISGTDQSWQYFEYEITGSGTHIINWIYSKDSSYSKGDDCGWVKDVMWKPYSSKEGVQLWENGPYWAETNIGAENPEDYGYYFWWGDTIGYKRENNQWVASDGSSSNFSFTSSNTTDAKSYSELQSEGWITSNGVLAPEHDAARAHWGSNWRMPTDSELQALRDNCTWTWTTKNGVYGYEVRGKGNYSGASIFLPAAGYGYGTSLGLAGSYGLYWSSVPTSGSSYYSCYLYFYSSNHYMRDCYYRYCGYTVRPVSDVPKTDVETYSVRFNANGGEGTMSDQSFTHGVEQALSTNAFTRDGYTFAGWSISADGAVVYVDGEVVKNLTIEANGVVDLYAVWTDGVQLWEGGPYWAETNIGAENPEDYGFYFWWGDTVGYKRVNNQWVASDGSSSNFSFDEASVPTYDKLKSELQSEGWITSSGVLASSHDAARAHLGSNWRMPTYGELQALCDNCTWTWTTKNGVYGYVVSGKGTYSGASIFLPAAGIGYGTSLYDAGSYGYYWSSVRFSDSYYYSWTPNFGSSYHCVGYFARYYGFPVRPVLDVH